MLAGEPGIGKTSLADRAAALAIERDFTVLWGRCWEAGGAPAYWPWLDLIAELARGLDEATLLRALGDGGAAALERLASWQAAEIAHHALEGPTEMLERAVAHALRAAVRAQDLLAYDEAVRMLVRARDALIAAGNPPGLRAQVLLALGEAHIRRGDTASGKEACREAATVAQSLDDAELGARAALIYGRVFAFGVVDPVLVGMLEESLEVLPPGDSALRARLLARLAAALQPSPAAAEPRAGLVR